MKLMKKILVSAIAISAIAAFNAVAFAEDEVAATPEPVVPAATYDATAKTITLSGFEVANDQKTLLILNDDVNAWDDTNAKAEAEGGAIVQIDQSTTINGVAIPVGEKEAGDKLWIRVGGDDTGFIELEYTIPGGGDDRFEDPTILLGSVDGDDVIDTVDASYLFGYVLNPYSLTGDALQAADVDDDGVADTVDASYIFGYVLNPSDSFLGTKTLADKVNLVPETTTAN